MTAGTGSERVDKTIGSNLESGNGRIAKEVYTGLLEAIPDAIVIVDADGLIEVVNGVAERLFGYSRAELVGQPVENLVPAALREQHRLHRAQYLAHPSSRAMSEAIGLRALRKDGSLVPVDITISPLRSQGETFVVCAIRDVTERALATEALRASEKRFRTLADQATDGIFLSDVAGNYQAMNDAACVMFGYSRDQLLSMTIGDLLGPGEIERLPGEIARLSSGNAVKSEWRFRRRDGSTFEGEVNARMLGDSQLLAVVRDVTERKRQEETQLRAQRFIEAVAKASPSWIYVFDIDDLSLRYLNRSILRDLGYPPEAQRKTRLEDFRQFLPAEDELRLPEILNAWRALADDDVHEAEYRIRHADGTYRWCLGRETVFARHADGRVHQVLGTLDDITERQRAHDALRQSEERFRTLIEDLDVGVLLQDAADDRILLSNHAAEEMLGLGARELDSLSSHTWPWRLLREDGTDYPRHLLPSVVAARTGHPVRNQIVGSVNVTAGICRWLQVTAMPRRELDDSVRHVLVTMTDVTGRKAAEDALIAAREEWEQSFNALTDWVSVLDGDGRVVHANRAMRDRFESRPGSLVGLHHRAIYEGEGTGSPDPCASVLIGGPPVEFTTTLAHVPGHFVISCYSLMGAGGAVHVVRDITKQRVLEEQLRQSQKIQAIGQLAGGVAHDFNNLLTVIIGCADLALLELPPGAAAARDSIDAIRAAADRATQLTRQLLVFSRKGAWEQHLLDLNKIVQHAERMLRRVIGEDVLIATTLSPGVLATVGDAAQIEQVVLNLALNARDAMPDGGLLGIETGNASFSQADCRADPAYRPGRFVRLTVSDTGSGMSPEVLAHLFEPFFTTKGPGKGTGLGLSTVYGIVEQAGGFIVPASTLGAGSTFTVFLPAVADDAEERPAIGEQERDATGSETVLVVEDEKALRQVIVRSLVSHGFRVLDVGSAAEALDLLTRDTGEIRILLTDVVMPGTGGRELAERARALRPGLPVLFVSGYSPETIPQQGFLAAGDQLLQKPFTPRALTTKVREALDATR